MANIFKSKTELENSFKNSDIDFDERMLKTLKSKAATNKFKMYYLWRYVSGEALDFLVKRELETLKEGGRSRLHHLDRVAKCSEEQAERIFDEVKEYFTEDSTKIGISYSSFPYHLLSDAKLVELIKQEGRTKLEAAHSYLKKNNNISRIIEIHTIGGILIDSFYNMDTRTTEEHIKYALEAPDMFNWIIKNSRHIDIATDTISDEIGSEFLNRLFGKDGIISRFAAQPKVQELIAKINPAMTKHHFHSSELVLDSVLKIVSLVPYEQRKMYIEAWGLPPVYEGVNLSKKEYMQKIVPKHKDWWDIAHRTLVYGDPDFNIIREALQFVEHENTEEFFINLVIVRNGKISETAEVVEQLNSKIPNDLLYDYVSRVIRNSDGYRRMWQSIDKGRREILLKRFLNDKNTKIREKQNLFNCLSDEERVLCKQVFNNSVFMTPDEFDRTKMVYKTEAVNPSGEIEKYPYCFKCLQFFQQQGKLIFTNIKPDHTAVCIACDATYGD